MHLATWILHGARYIRPAMSQSNLASPLRRRRATLVDFGILPMSDALVSNNINQQTTDIVPAAAPARPVTFNGYIPVLQILYYLSIQNYIHYISHLQLLPLSPQRLLLPPQHHQPPSRLQRESLVRGSI